MTNEINIFGFDVPRFIKFYPDAGCARIFLIQYFCVESYHA